MAFTYNLVTQPDISNVRLRIGDTDSSGGKGVRPGGSNYQDDEVQLFLTAAGSVMGAVIQICEALAVDWSRLSTTRTGPRSTEYSRISEHYRQMATELRAQYGGSIGFAIPTTRADAYTENAGADDFAHRTFFFPP